MKKIFEMVMEIFGGSKDEGDGIAMLLRDVKDEIRHMRAKIDEVKDDDLLEMYVYRLRAAEDGYRHLLQMARDNNKEKKTG